MAVKKHNKIFKRARARFGSVSLGSVRLVSVRLTEPCRLVRIRFGSKIPDLVGS